MDAEQKGRILKRYLKDKSLNPADVHLSDDDLVSYIELDNLLDYIALHNNGLFDFTILESDNAQWQLLTSVLNYSVAFISGSPPSLDEVNEESASFSLQYWKNAKEISALPKDNYYARSVIKPLDEDVELNNLLKKSREKLYELLQTIPNNSAFNPADNEQVDAQISIVKKTLNSLAVNPQKIKLQNKLNILLDLSKVNHINRLRIPQDHGPFFDYCTIAEPMDGMTEKVSLMRLTRVKEQLSKFCEQNTLTAELYNANHIQYALFAEAIIKLPKHGSFKEVQREAIALNISRILGLDTAASITVAYDGLPALFIPFDNIDLLSAFSTGKTFTAGLGIFGHTYTHYSTIKPIGEGIQSDSFISDFGNALGLLYLCSDTDAIGGYCQNKGLRNSCSLFIFDQVVMDTEKFSLDSRLNLLPGQFIIKHTRHGQGRNRTIIEDSSMNNKYASILQLKALEGKIIQYLNYVAWNHQNRIEVIIRQLQDSLEKEQRVKLSEELTNLQILEQDAEVIKSKITNRIAKIDSIFPKKTGSISDIDIRQALVFEKLINNPTLYTDDGRAYKHPWTNRHVIKITNINDLGNEKVQLQFNNKIPENMISFIKRRDARSSITSTSINTLTISKEHLRDLTETLLHPENNLIWSQDINYLDLKDLGQIKLAYRDGNREKIIRIISEYQAKLNIEPIKIIKRLECIKYTESAIKELIRTANDKGFGLHVLKKFYFDAQQQLQMMINPFHTPANLSQAFLAALKLDRVSEFNSVVAEALAQNKVTDTPFTDFLTSCIQRVEKARNYKEAQKESQALSREAQQVIDHLKQATVELYAQSKFKISLIDSLDDDLVISVDLNPLTKAPIYEETVNETQGLKM